MQGIRKGACIFSYLCYPMAYKPISFSLFSLALFRLMCELTRLYRKSGTRKLDSFDARDIFKQYGSEEWGEYIIREAHLSQRFLFDESGYYHCCASVPFPEDVKANWFIQAEDLQLLFWVENNGCKCYIRSLSCDEAYLHIFCFCFRFLILPLFYVPQMRSAISS